MSPNDPTDGCWLSPDPLGGDISNPQSLNRYAYALNNPTTLTDPLGLDSCTTGVDSNGNPVVNCPSTTVTVTGSEPNCYDNSDPLCASEWDTYLTSPCSGFDLLACTGSSGGGGGASAPAPAPKPAPPLTLTIGPAPPRLNPPPDNRPSCFSIFLSGLGGNPSPTGDLVEQGAKNASTTAAQLAAVYSAVRGLTVPLRSPYVRLFTNVSEGLGFVGEITPIVFAASDVIPAEYASTKVNLTGQCQNNFWSSIP